MVAVGGLTPSRACEVETEVFFLPLQLVDFAEVDEKVDILCQAGGSYPAASSAGDGLMLLV